ncbi:MAG: dihydropteroate synthase [Nitrospirales bacterium]|nr:dihydropteroate synthase [Nitrospirales bacterium]
MDHSIAPIHALHCRGHAIALGGRCLVMGVLNVTPDSFSDGGQFLTLSQALHHAEQMLDDGADMIDVGGESTRPGTLYMDEAEEISRIRPIFEVLGRQAKVPLSIDTRKSSVARIALDLGASIVNDVSALQDDPEMVRTVRETDAGVILMHRKGHSITMQDKPFYRDVVREVRGFLRDRATVAEQVGISSDRIIVDPGIGFGKTRDHNLKLLANISQIQELGFPVLIGASRKAFLGELTGRPVGEREMGHAAVIATAVWQGVHLVRVHDVKAVSDVVKVAQALRKSHE